MNDIIKTLVDAVPEAAEGIVRALLTAIASHEDPKVAAERAAEALAAKRAYREAAGRE